MHQRELQARESELGCGNLSHDAGARSPLRIAMLGIRSAGIGVLLLGAMSVAVGCSDTPAATGGTGGTTGTGGSSGAGGAGDLDGSTDCSMHTDVDTYAANMTKQGKNNIMSFLLLQSDPGPPAMGDNVWKLKVTGADAMPVSKGLKIRVSMPSHGHDSLVAPKFSYDAAAGTYTLNPINFSPMGGVWRVVLTMNDPNDSSITVDTVDFNFCIR